MPSTKKPATISRFSDPLRKKLARNDRRLAAAQASRVQPTGRQPAAASIRRPTRSPVDSPQRPIASRFRDCPIRGLRIPGIPGDGRPTARRPPQSVRAAHIRSPSCAALAPIRTSDPSAIRAIGQGATRDAKRHIGAWQQSQGAQGDHLRVARRRGRLDRKLLQIACLSQRFGLQPCYGKTCVVCSAETGRVCPRHVTSTRTFAVPARTAVARSS